MKTSAIFLGAALGLAAAAPLNARGEGMPAHPKVDDGIIINYALTLEHLEDAYYRQGLQNFTAEQMLKAFPNNPKLASIVTSIAADESSHVEFLTTALTAAGGKPVKPCEYSFPVTDVKSFVAVASILEGVGVSAYLGAAGSIADKMTLGAAATILTTEARHNSLLRDPLGQAAAPNRFDYGLDFNPVFSLAAGFIKSCPPENPPLPFTAFPSMAVASGSSFVEGNDIFFTADAKAIEEAKKKGGCQTVAFFAEGGPKFAPAKLMETAAGPLVTCKIPKGCQGQIYAVLTNSADKATDDAILAGPCVVEVQSTRP